MNIKILILNLFLTGNLFAQAPVIGLHDYATTIETKEDGTQISTKKIVPRKTEAEILEERKKNPIPIVKNHPKTDGGSDPEHYKGEEERKAFMLKYYASEQFQKDSLRFAQSMKTGTWKENGWTEQQLENYIKEEIKNMKLNYERP